MMIDLRPWAVCASLCLVACNAPLEFASVDLDDVTVMPVISQGTPATASVYDAVVSLHERRRRGRGLDPEPFCTGTLISADVVLTAAHCVDVAGWAASRPRAIDPSQMGIHIGPTPLQGMSGNLYRVAEVAIYPAYDRVDLVHDIALLRLQEPVSHPVTPIAPLPSSLGFVPSDRGELMDFVGYGVTHNSDGGSRLHVLVPLGGLGCSVPGCDDPGDRATQISYEQSNGGPCSGDSGGPMLVSRGGDTYVGGITSWGDRRCRRFGVSTRVDAYEGWIDAFTAASAPAAGWWDAVCGDGVCGTYENCDGSRGYDSCPADCAGDLATLGFCEVEGVCRGRACP